jgi:hypothetical protein
VGICSRRWPDSLRSRTIVAGQEKFKQTAAIGISPNLRWKGKADSEKAN